MIFTPRTRLQPEHRRALVVEAAFAILASEGFEGLRTREVADAVQINSATLHYYFPTKEDLVAAVAERLAERFTTERGPERRGEGALAALRQQFSDVRFYRDQQPDLVAVYRELAIRAIRDETTRTLVDGLNVRWQAGVEAILRQGKKEGVFRSEIVPAAAATAVVAALWGAVAFLCPSSSILARMCVELENGLVAKKGSK